jgi:hypothetical protein
MGKVGERKAVGKTTPKGESQMERRKLSVFGRMPQNRTPHIQQSSIHRKIRTTTLD